MRRGRGRRERKGVSLLSLPPFFASLLPRFPQKRLILRLRTRDLYILRRVVVLAREPASFWWENMVAVVTLLRVLSK